MKKKIISAFLAAAMLASLASCGGKEEQTTTTTTTAAAATTPEETAAPEPEVNVSCQELAEAARSAVEEMTVMLWPVEDKEMEEGNLQMITDVMGYDVSLFSEYSVVMQAMSVHLDEIVVIKPADGKTDEVKAMLEKRKENIKESVAFYPEQQENAEKTIVGSVNGIVYLLCGVNPPAMEEKLLAAADG